MALHSTPDLDQFIARMDRQVEEHAGQRDARERFLLMYRTFKNELRHNLQAGRFTDTAWSEAICCRMAEMYFEADEAYQLGLPTCPDPWAHAFDAARNEELNLLQDMLLGMNAHINYDLPICAYDTMRLFGDVSRELPALGSIDHGDIAFDAMMRGRYSDFLLINEIAWESIDKIQVVATRRFSRVLGVAARVERAGPVQLSKLITTRIIAEYRDRAWGHTLLLLMAEDVQQLDAVKQLTTQFAMDAADLVTRVDFHPVRSMQLLRRGRVLPDTARRENLTRSQSVVPFLVAQLTNRSTRRIARRALIEYGAVIQPILCELLDVISEDDARRAQLLQVIASHPTPLAAAAIQKQIAVGSTTAVDEPVRLLANLQQAGIQMDVDKDGMRRAIDLTTWHARWTAASYAELGIEYRGWLLDEILRRRQVICLLRILRLGYILSPDKRLMAAAESLAPTLDPHTCASVARAVDSVIPGYGTVLVRPLSPVVECEKTDHPSSPIQCLSQMCFHSDSWLRACALHRVGELGLKEQLQDVIRGLNARDPRVQEASLQASTALLSSDELRKVLEHSLPPMKVAWVRDYADKLLNGQGAEDGMYSTIEKVLLLKNAELFVDIPAEDLADIAGFVQSGAFRKGRRLITEGLPGEALFLLVRGAVDVLDADGQALARVEPFAVLGETSILLDEPCSATCIAAEAGHALRIMRSDFERMLRDYPDVTLGLLRVMTRRVQTANRRKNPVSSIVS